MLEYLREVRHAVFDQGKTQVTLQHADERLAVPEHWAGSLQHAQDQFQGRPLRPHDAGVSLPR
eukprot:2915456-Pyramimonas_sp.AAC.1